MMKDNVFTCTERILSYCLHINFQYNDNKVCPLLLPLPSQNDNDNVAFPDT